MGAAVAGTLLLGLPVEAQTASPASGDTPAPPVLVAPRPHAGAAASPTGTAGSSPRAREQPTYAGVLTPLLSRVGTTRAVVVDLADGRQVWQEGADRLVTPASTTKLLTAAAVLSAFGPEHTFTTRVVRGAMRGSLVLVGGGDPLLSAGAGRLGTGVAVTPIERLARRTVRAVAALPTAQRPRRVVVRYDDSLFARPAAPPTWDRAYVGSGVAGPVGALSLDGARVRPDDERRVGDPGDRAAAVLAARLSALGLPSRAGPRVVASRGRPPLAEVASVPLADVVEHTLAASDNDAAEVLARQVAVAAALPGTAAGAASAVRRTVAALGVDLTGARILDGSGLSRGGRLTPRQLIDVLGLAVDPDHGELGPVLSGLAVAGLTGTLAGRFAKPVYAAGRGVVRAKTGGLRGVSGLVGTTVGADGRTYGFAFITNGVRGLLNPARHALDAAAVALTECGCR